MKNEKLICLLVSIFLFLIFFSSPVLAQSSYVLPYPSSMPGNLSYKIHVFYEDLSRYWYFGDFGQFNYNLKLSDKYLVEAKTLFEYKQYLLGYRALKKSDQYFVNILPSLLRAKKNGKNTFQKRTVYAEAAQKHIETLKKMMDETPDIFNWQPEKVSSTKLNIKDAIIKSIRTRGSDL